MNVDSCVVSKMSLVLTQSAKQVTVTSRRAHGYRFGRRALPPFYAVPNNKPQFVERYYSLSCYC